MLSLSVGNHTISMSLLVYDRFTKILNLSYIEVTSNYVSGLQYRIMHGYDYE